MKLRPIVTDTYDFPTLIEEGYVYVDNADAILETDKSVYIFEFKYGKSAKAVDAALEVACEPADGEVSGEVNGEVNSGCGEVKSYVAEHPGCRRREILLAVRLSARTLDRKLATLIAHKMIEFRGAPKTGGVLCAERRGEE